jgi:hypothetical protein
MSVFLFDEEETQGKINIDDLYEKQQMKDLKQVSIFNKILNRIHTKIRNTSRNRTGDKFIWFTVPEFIFGEPVYQQADCIAYLVDKLEDNKFHVRYMHPNTLFVSWAHLIPSYVRQEIRKKMGIVVDDRGNIIEKLEGGQGDNLNERMIAKPEEKDTGKKDKDKNYNPVSNYKPTGSFIYDKEFFEKIEKKFS